MAKRIVFAGLILGFLGLMLAGCMQLASLNVAPTSAIVESGDTVTFIATDHLGNPVTVTWNVASGPGSINSAGVYTAPAVTAVTNATITASRVDRPAITASATVTIKPPIPPINAALVDASGDAFGVAPKYDVTGIHSSRTSDTLTLTIHLTGTPSIPPSGFVGASDLAGFVCFDTDEDKLTGIPSASYYFAPTVPMAQAIGVDYFVSLFFVHDLDKYDVYKVTTSPLTFTHVGNARWSVVGTTLTLTIPLTELGGDDGITDMNSVLGNGTGPTDCAPDEVTAVVTAKDLNPKIIIIEEEYPYYDFLSGLEITGEGWLQTRSSTI